MSRDAWRKYWNFVLVWVLLSFALQALNYYTGDEPEPLWVPVAMAALGSLLGLIPHYMRGRRREPTAN